MARENNGNYKDLCDAAEVKSAEMHINGIILILIPGRKFGLIIKINKFRPKCITVGCLNDTSTTPGQKQCWTNMGWYYFLLSENIISQLNEPKTNAVHTFGSEKYVYLKNLKDGSPYC